MLSKNQIKLIKSLSQKKFRQQLNLFTVEGPKGISEFLNSQFKLRNLYTIDPIFEVAEDHQTLISQSDLKRISNLKTPNTAIAIFEMPNSQTLAIDGLVVALDDVRDPGNLGTIIRLCDWYSVEHIICSETTVDCFNPKVVQATMGSLTRVTVHYQNLRAFITSTELTTYAAVMDGADLYKTKLSSNGVIVFGNEAKGISKEIEQCVDHKITIPRFGQQLTESLNVA
ncbi:MAG: RNA methyltransferase, partial [Winogradskyella sp.]|nr:RNA methyltransferase [Winogradskyella sp.]